MHISQDTFEIAVGTNFLEWMSLAKIKNNALSDNMWNYK